jgi:hypothetical protein
MVSGVGSHLVLQVAETDNENSNYRSNIMWLIKNVYFVGASNDASVNAKGCKRDDLCDDTLS